MSNSENSARIAKNTLLLYFRMLLIMAVTLYTSRVILNALGIEDYGIYNVIGGVVAMFSVISSSLSSAITRFITYELGKNNKARLKIIFSSSLTIQIVLAIIVCIFAEIGGIWFLNNKMIIPAERLLAANWVLQCSIFTFAINLISVPYNAVIIAHEHMKAFAYVSIIEVLLKLIVAFTLYISLFDKLIIYGIMLLMVSVIIRIIYGIYCKKHFEECSFCFEYDKKLLKEMSSFAGWNFIGSSSAVFRDQGVNIVINLFCGPIVNAARGISFQVNAALQSFVGSFVTALNPQIIKSYASAEYEYMMQLLYRGSRFSFYLLLFLCLPMLIETNAVLIFWLKIVPEHSVDFVRLVLVFAMLDSLSRPLIVVQLATGDIRNYQLIVGGLQMLNFPISYVLLRYGIFPEVTMIVAIVLSVSCLFARLLILRGMIGISIKYFINKVCVNVIRVGILSSLVPLMLYYFISESSTRCILIFAISFLCTFIIVFFIGFSRSERKYFTQKIMRLKLNFNNVEKRY